MNDDALVKEKTVRALTDRMIAAVNALEFDPAMVGQATDAALSALASAGSANAARGAAVQAAADAVAPTDAQVATLTANPATGTGAAVREVTANEVDKAHLAGGAAMMIKLAQGVDATLAVLSDSTGLYWPVQLANHLAGKFPKVRVILNVWLWDTFYDPAAVGYTTTTVSSPVDYISTLTVYNGTVRGSSATWWINTADIATMYPVKPDALAVSLGHNEYGTTPATFSTLLDNVVARFHTLHAGVPIILTSQNPRNGVAVNITEHAARERSKRGWARTRRYGYIPSFEAYLSSVESGAELVPDGIHPSASGAQTWSAAALRALSEAAEAPAARPLPISRGVPDMMGVGTTALAFTSRPALGFDDAQVAQYAWMHLDVPVGGDFNMSMVWSKKGAGTGGVRWAMRILSELAAGSAVNNDVTLTSRLTTDTAPAANIAKVTALGATPVSLPAGRYLMGIYRSGTHAEDTLTEQAALLEVRFAPV